MDITAYDECKVTLFQDQAVPVDPSLPAIPSADSKIDWTKWGTIIGGIALVVTILIAVLR
jgi:hypothetical protein